MTKEEIKAKLEQAKTNKVLPEKMRALSIAKYEKMLADLPEEKANKDITTLKELEKKDPKMYEWYLDLKRDTGMPFVDFKEQYLSTKAEPKKEVKKTGHKYKLGDMYRSDFDYDGMMEYAKKANDKTPLKDLKKLADSMEDVNYHTEAKKIFALIDKKNKVSKNEPKTESTIKQGDYVEFKDKYKGKVFHVNAISGDDATVQGVKEGEKGIFGAKLNNLRVVQKDTKNYDKKEPDYDCDKLIAEVKAKREKAKKSAEKSAKKPEVTKAKERIEKTYEAIETKVEKGEFTKTQLQKLIEETREYLKRLEKAIKNIDKYEKGGGVKSLPFGVTDNINMKGSRFEKNLGYKLTDEKWTSVKNKGILKEDDLGGANDWRHAINEKYGYEKYKVNMYSPSLDKLRELNQEEFYINKGY